MLNLQSLKVFVQNSDIAPMVLSLTMYETIQGNLRGMMVVQDHMNFMDTFLPSANQAPVKIEWQYQGYLWTNYFYADGIENMEMSKMGKKYTIQFLSYTTMNSNLKNINATFSGRGDQIIYDIFRELNPLTEDSTQERNFYFDSTSITKGRYVVPNIKGVEALNNVINSCYDINKSPLLLYQRLCDEGGTRLTSLHDMDKNVFGMYESDDFNKKSNFVLKAALAGADENSDGIDPSLEIGTVSSFMMSEFNTNFISKISSGIYGSKIQQISLDKTTSEEILPAELTEIPTTAYKLQDNLYDNDTKSIFSTSAESDSHAAHNQKRRLFNMRMQAIGVTAVPGLSCGYSIETDSGGSDINQSKTDTRYIIESIQHKFAMNDGEFSYLQDIELIRDGSVDV